MILDQRRFPIGPWQERPEYSLDSIKQISKRIQQLPSEYAKQTANLSDEDLLKHYREGSFTVRQLVHHVADMHILHYARIKNALLAPGQTGWMVDMNGWANTEEAQTAPIDSSLNMLEGTHQRIAFLAQTLSPEQLAITYHHPFRQRDLTLAQALHIVMWHAEHHLAHIRLALAE
jgi:uncharacterized damage-inducible protein DinB